MNCLENIKTKTGQLLTTVFLFCWFSNSQGQTDSSFIEARNNAILFNQGFNRCIRYVNAWMKHADPSTGLIPRNLRESKDFWNAWDAAADNYPFMVMTSSILMPEFFKGKAHQMLKTERQLTSRIGKLPDSYSFSKKTFLNETIDTNQIIFGAAEYMKDGLIPLTEWLGKSAWSDRMLEILNDLPRLTRMARNISGKWYGNSATVEVNGDLLQVLSRMYWFTGKTEYLDWAIEIADHYLTEQALPTIALDRLRIRDHGCEIISGLCETYTAVYFARPEKRNQWRPLIHKMLDRILEVGRNEDGLFFDEIDPVKGKVLSSRLADNFGYTLNAYWFIANIDSTPTYRDAVIKALSSLNEKYRKYDWENGSADGYADAVEGALNLYNREPLVTVKSWLDSEIKNLWAFQKEDGMIEGWHGDGNFARTTIMYCLWKTQGILPDRWKGDLEIGAVRTDRGVKLVINAPTGWKGKIRFESPRHSDKMHMPVDYPRINQFQEWFTVDEAKLYRVNTKKTGGKLLPGKKLKEGLSIDLKSDKNLEIEILEIL